MNDKEAIEILNHYLEMEEFDNAGDFLIAIDKVLSLLEKKDKQIDLMAEQIAFNHDINSYEDVITIKKQLKEKYEKKAEEDK